MVASSRAPGVRFSPDSTDQFDAVLQSPEAPFHERLPSEVVEKASTSVRLEATPAVPPPWIWFAIFPPDHSAFARSSTANEFRRYRRVILGAVGQDFVKARRRF